MHIEIKSGVGQGETETAAFDAALLNAGIGNYNLVYLSSIIPTGTKIVKSRIGMQERNYGDRLYVVISKRYEKQQGKSAWAGLGWIQEASSRKGFFAEYDGTDRESVENAIAVSLAGMARNRNLSGESIDSEIIGIKCRGQTVCAVIAAVFCSEPWRS